MVAVIGGMFASQVAEGVFVVPIIFAFVAGLIWSSVRWWQLAASRMRDIGVHWALAAVVPFGGPYGLPWLLLTPGTSGHNRHGPAPVPPSYSSCERCRGVTVRQPVRRPRWQWWLGVGVLAAAAIAIATLDTYDYLHGDNMGHLTVIVLAISSGSMLTAPLIVGWLLSHARRWRCFDCDPPNRLESRVNAELESMGVDHPELATFHPLRKSIEADLLKGSDAGALSLAAPGEAEGALSLPDTAAALSLAD